jgi:hypothetical protein
VELKQEFIYVKDICNKIIIIFLLPVFRDLPTSRWRDSAAVYSPSGTALSIWFGSVDKAAAVGGCGLSPGQSLALRTEVL